VREWLSQLVELRRRAMHFQPDQVGDLERFCEHRAHAVEVREERLGIGVTFPAENLIAVDSEPIKKILFFAGRLFNERRERSFERIEFPGMGFEVRVQTDEVRKRFHLRILHRALNRVEQ